MVCDEARRRPNSRARFDGRVVYHRECRDAVRSDQVQVGRNGDPVQGFRAPKSRSCRELMPQKSRLPDLHSMPPPLVNFIGTAAINELHRSFQSCSPAGSKQEVQMIRHEDELVKEVSARRTVAE